MVDKCPKCGETLVTRTIQKKMGPGSIDLPVAQICPNCNWSRDLTGAGDIVAKPHVPEAGTGKEIKPEVRRADAAPLQDKPVPVKPRQETKKPVPEKPEVIPEKTRQTSAAPVKWVIDTNKVITIILSLLVIAGLIWTFLPKGGSSETTGSTHVPTPVVTSAPTPTATAIATATAVTTQPGMPGNNITVKVDRDRGFLIPAQQDLKIRQGDGVIWKNDGIYSLTLVSNEGLFEDRLLDNEKITTYIFKKAGTYTFNIVVKGVKKFEGTVVVEP